MSDKFYELQDETIKKYNDIFNSKAFPVKINTLFQGNKKQKQMIKVAKIADQYEFELEKQIFVSINEDLFEQYDEVSQKILIEHAIDKINVDGNTGKVSIKPLKLVTSVALVSKYGIDEVARANQIESLTREQIADAKSEEFIK
jgi:hypothetical protein